MRLREAAEDIGDLLSVGAVAARLGACRVTVYRLVWNARLPSIRVGSAVRIAPEDLAAFIERRGPGST